MSLLHEECRKFNLPVVEELIDCSNVNVVNSRGRTALHELFRRIRKSFLRTGPPIEYTVQRVNSIIVSFISRGYDLTIADRNGNSPFHMSCHPINESLMRILISNGLNINQANLAGETILHIACMLYMSSTVKSLIRYGANVNARTKEGNTPLHYLYSSILVISNVSQFHRSVHGITKSTTKYITYLFTLCNVNVQASQVDGYSVINYCAKNAGHECLTMLLNGIDTLSGNADDIIRVYSDVNDIEDILYMKSHRIFRYKGMSYIQSRNQIDIARHLIQKGFYVRMIRKNVETYVDIDGDKLTKILLEHNVDILIM